MGGSLQPPFLPSQPPPAGVSLRHTPPPPPPAKWIPWWQRHSRAGLGGAPKAGSPWWARLQCRPELDGGWVSSTQSPQCLMSQPVGTGCQQVQVPPGLPGARCPGGLGLQGRVSCSLALPVLGLTHVCWGVRPQSEGSQGHMAVTGRPCYLGEGPDSSGAGMSSSPVGVVSLYGDQSPDHAGTVMSRAGVSSGEPSGSPLVAAWSHLGHQVGRGPVRMRPGQEGSLALAWRWSGWQVRAEAQDGREAVVAPDAPA